MSEPYEVRRSRRRTRTMAIVREAGRLVVMVPARMTRSDERELIPSFVSRYLTAEAGRRLPRHDTELTDRASALFRRYLAVPGEVPPPFTVTWSSRQLQRWGSCTTATGQIRISERLRGMPDWVGDYVLLHELTHLLERTHSARFAELLGRYPQAERAAGYLQGWTDGQGQPGQDC